MRLSSAFGTFVIIPALCLYGLCAAGQSTQSKDTQVSETKGIPPRATPADYQAQAPAGTVTVAAEFLGHSIPTPDGKTFTTDDYVAIETGLFGPPEARLTISVDEFSLRINEKKAPLPSQRFGMVFRSLKDPEWEDNAAVEAKAAKAKSTSINTGGQGGQNEPPAPVHMPIELQRAMQQRVQKTALPEGDRALPQAGLIFFPYRGKVAGIHSIELTYTGPAGTATLTLQP